MVCNDNYVTGVSLYDDKSLVQIAIQLRIIALIKKAVSGVDDHDNDDGEDDEDDIEDDQDDNDDDDDDEQPRQILKCPRGVSSSDHDEFSELTITISPSSGPISVI